MRERKPGKWCSNNLLLEDKVVAQSIERDITNRFQMNDDGSADFITVWECFKVYRRGVAIIAQMAYKQKSRQSVRIELIK